MLLTVKGIEVLQRAEIEDNDHADKNLEDQEELALRKQVCFAGFPDQLRNLAHRRVHRQVLQLDVGQHAEQEAERAESQAGHQQDPAAGPHKSALVEVGKDQVRFSAGFGRRVLGQAVHGRQQAKQDCEQARQQQVAAAQAKQ